MGPAILLPEALTKQHLLTLTTIAYVFVIVQWAY